MPCRGVPLHARAAFLRQDKFHPAPMSAFARIQLPSFSRKPTGSSMREDAARCPAIALSTGCLPDLRQEKKLQKLITFEGVRMNSKKSRSILISAFNTGSMTRPCVDVNRPRLRELRPRRIRHDIWFLRVPARPRTRRRQTSRRASKVAGVLEHGEKVTILGAHRDEITVFDPEFIGDLADLVVFDGRDGVVRGRHREQTMQK